MYKTSEMIVFITNVRKRMAGETFQTITMEFFPVTLGPDYSRVCKSRETQHLLPLPASNGRVICMSHRSTLL
jgi:hypothetical protein